MAKRSKSLRRYASGGNPRYSTLDAGLTAMRQQSDTQIRQLEKLSGQRERADNIFLDSFKGKLSREADNRKEKYEIEEVTPRKMRADALEKNNQRLQERFQQKIKEQDDLAATWGELAPSLAKAGTELWSASRGFLDTRAAVNDYEDLIRNGTLDKLSQFQVATDKKGQKIFGDYTNLFTSRLSHYLKTGDINAKKEAEVMLYQLKTNNPKLRDKLVADVKADISSIIRDTIAMVEDPESESPIKVDHKNVASIIHFRGVELCRQLGINPKSKSGLEIQKAFRSEGLKYEQQYTFGYEYNRDSAVVNGQPDLIKVSHKDNDYEGANNNWKIMVSTYQSLPVQSRSGEWSAPINVNPIESFKDLLKEQMHNPRYANNYTLFAEEMYGKNAANPYGYVIVNPEGDTNKKHNRILGKHPNLENEMLIEWSRIYDNVKKAEQKSTEAKYAAEAGPFIDSVKNGDFKGKDAELWKAFDKYKNNPVVKATIGRSLAFSDETIKKDLLKSQLFRDLRSGNTSAIIDSWISAPEGDQDITWAHDNLFEIADLENVELNKLDNHLVDMGDKNLTTIIKDNPLTQSRHYSTNEIANDAAAFMLNYYVNNRNKFDSSNAAWEASKAQLNFMLGIDANGLPIDPDPDTRIRGHGEFKHRVGNTGDNRIVFLSKVGTVYGNTSSGEIKEVLDGNKTKKQKSNFLLDAVAIQSQDHFSDALLLEAAATNGHTANHPLLGQVYPHLKALGMTRKEFLQEVINKRFPNTKEQKDIFVETVGSDWCDEHFKPAQNIKNPNDKLMGVCMDRVSKQTNTPISILALYASALPKVKEFLLKERDEIQAEEIDGAE